MKKSLITLFLLVLIVSPLIFAAGVEDSIQAGLDKAQSGKELVDKSSDQVFWEEKWDYLGNEWKGLILKNKFIAGFDAFFSKISIVFQILFGVPYSMSLALFGILVIWTFFLMNASRLVGASGFFDGKMSLLGGLLLVIILAQFRVFEIIVVFLGNVIFSPQYSWTRVLLFILVVGVFMVFDYLDRMLGKYIKKMKVSEFDAEAKASKQSMIEFTKNMLGMSKLADK